MLQIIQFTQRIPFKLQIQIKDVEKNNWYCAIDGFIKEIIVLHNQLISFMKTTKALKKLFKSFGRKVIIVG